ncbi:MAG: calcium-binding protein [Novosphingobium sp.]|uniref:calcium-binding protein n=1 Tax=Novosphingobium sp. TaxID=1874826 RepID=UPI0030174C1C
MITLDGGADTDTLVYSYNGGVASQIDLNSATDQTIGDNAGVNNFENLDWSQSSFGLKATGSSAANTITGSALADTIDGGAGLDVIDGQGGDDRITYRGNAASINGSANADTLVVTGSATINLNLADQTSGDTAAVSGFENVDGSTSSASFYAIGLSGTYSILVGGSAGDTLRAGAYGASITGNGGADTLGGGIGADSFYINGGDFAAGESIDGAGSADGDFLYVRATTDFTVGSLANLEYLYASAQDAAGNYLSQGLTVTLTGAQTASFTAIYANSVVTGTAEAFIVNVESGSTVNLGLVNWANFDAQDTLTVNGTTGNETITGPNIASVIRADSGDDTVKTAAGYSYWATGTQVFGDAGADRIDYGYRLNTATLDGGADSDTLVFNYAEGVTDQINLSLADQSVGDNTTVMNFENLDWSASSSGLIATGSSGNNTIVGSQVADTVNGGGGNDTISGGSGNDILEGQDGSDTLTGGSGSDVFVWMSRYSAPDTITDFLASEDDLRFALSAFDFNGAAFDRQVSAKSGGANITGADLINYDGGALNSVSDVQNYLSAAAGGSVGEGVFIVGKDSSNNTVLYHALDASYTVSTDVVLVANLGILAAKGSLQLADFLFV